jgi:2-polyprenyl-3-methyl-5-hydroxy-6-metoxy-1,4-benzoquinol methylase
VAAHHAQSQKIRAARGITGDRWEAASPFFKANPRRTDDVEVNRLLQQINPSATVFDIGGGAGRFALPLALQCQHVTVIEPSPSMPESLRQITMEADIDNVTIVAKRWEEAEVNPADVVISAHVIYMIEDIRTFVVKMLEHARDKVLMPTFMRPPMARYTPFWRWVHEEGRAELPGAAELMQVLWEMDIYPNVEMFEPISFRAFKNWQMALERAKAKT